ncbi:tRNA (adenine(37)-N6)-methyltransferase [Phymastichus coffea]|uniref:tRNA (adenine(37)-N6)-methyltransferase n=1 Tax=Phymastichus coffea TaxID=108790 RepID=UPI00273A8F00|nr:tRNA (adenine(37)-N6)-methyltransferase [Phymastichus coffea]
MMATNCANFETNSKFLLEQLITARKEINNLRQQIKSLRYVHERDVSSIKRLLGLSTSGLNSFSDEAAQLQAPTNSRSNEPSSMANGNVLTCRPIGVVSTWFPKKRGTPRQPTVCSETPGKITLFKSIFTNPEHALQGLEEFSHMWILFYFHKNDIVHVRAKVAPPRLNGIRTGVFSTRSPHRPSPIGLSLVKIIKIEDCTIYFEGVDMIDQTPVLDIKPYIPHYDNPVHIENILQSVHSKELRQNNTSPTSIDNPDGWFTTDIDEVPQDSHDHHSNLPQQRGNQPLLYTSPISSNSTSNSSADVSRDEELAMRLQAEEFQETLYFDIDNDNSSFLEDNELAAIIADRDNLNRIGFNSVVPENSDEQNLGTSRLLEGADGPNAICGTDLNLISRRTLNLRLDDSSSSSSPIRMGVREAPDGEEGFDLLQPNVSQAQNLANNSNNSDLNFQSIIRQTSDNSTDGAVRVPDWISKPKTSTLSVVFNERSLLQLQEILHEKAEEKRQAVENILKEDPRSVYLRQRYGNQFYTFLIHDLHITCKFDDDKKIVTVFQIRHAGRTCECGQPEWQCIGHNHSSSSTFNQD